MRLQLKRILDTLARQSLTNMLAREKYAAELRSSSRYADKRCLTRCEHRVFSQNGEDGAIREIMKRIGGGRYFVEIGAGDGSENNTTFLLSLGWSGIWIEGNAANAVAIRKKFAKELSSGQLTLQESFVSAENINSLLAPCGAHQIDILSLDLDRNTYHVWKAMDMRPRLSVIEYNPSIPPGVDWAVDYVPDRWWDGSSYYGASLTAMARVGAEKGDLLVGCDLTGTNAYFVRADLCEDRFLSPGDVSVHYEPCRNYLQGRPTGHPRNYSDLS